MSPFDCCTPKRQRVHPSVARSRKQEKEIAKRIGGQTTIASGALQVKGDVRKHRAVRLEAKTTGRKSFSVTREMLRKIEDAALPYDELPVLEIEFLDEQARPVGKVCVVPSYVLDMLVEFREGK